MNDVTNYTAGYYQRDIAETWFWRKGLLRPDQLAAVAYAHGWPFIGNEGLKPRQPAAVLSIGCGRGELERTLEGMGVGVLGYDPSPGAELMYEGRRFTSELPEQLSAFDTIIFCESIEHIPLEQTRHILDSVAVGTRVIIVNWISHHPLGLSPDGWDHITEITDELYDELSQGFSVLVRNGSHLVMEKQ